MKNWELKTKLLAGYAALALIVIVGGLTGIAGLRASADAQARMEALASVSSMLLHREVDHLSWSEALLKQALAGEGVRVQLDDHRCALGQWFYGEGRTQMETLPPEVAAVVGSIEQPHSRLHASGRRLDEVGAGGQATPREVLRLYEAETTPPLEAVRERLGEARGLAEAAIAREGEAFHAVQRRAYAFLMGSAALGLLLAAVLGIVGTRAITTPIAEAVRFARKMAEGDLAQKIDSDRSDELGVLLGALNQMSESLRGMIKEIVGNAGVLSASSTELSATSGQLTAGSRQTSEKAHAVATAAEQMSANTGAVAASMEQTSSSLSHVSSATEQVTATIAEIAGNSEKARQITAEASQQAADISAQMNELGQAAQEIGKVTETINEISSQTSLLALNATIEAARAGEAGKGFAVVANEVKELAQQTATATEDIKAKIAGVQSSAGGAISEIGKISEVIHQITDIVGTIASAIEEQASMSRDIAGSIAQANSGVSEANGQVSQSSAVAREIARDIAVVDLASSEIVSGGEQVQASATELSRVAGQLESVIGEFQV